MKETILGVLIALAIWNIIVFLVDVAYGVVTHFKKEKEEQEDKRKDSDLSEFERRIRDRMNSN